MMAIGYIALIFGAICGIIYLIESQYPQEKKVVNTDYNSRYKSLAVKEI